MNRAVISAGLVVLATALVESVSAQAPRGDPMEGTWVLNVAKSTFAPGAAPPRAGSYRYVNRSDGYTMWVSSTVGATGIPGFNFSLRKYDGRDYPTYNVTSLTALVIDGDSSPNTTQSARVIDAYNTELFNKTDGVVVSKVTRTMARDGKSFIQRTYNPAGELTGTSVYEKVEQPPTN